MLLVVNHGWQSEATAGLTGDWSLSHSLSDHLPTYLPTYRPTYLPTHVPTYLSTELRIHPSIYSSIRLFIYPSISVAIYLSTYPSMNLSIYPSIYLFIHLWIKATAAPSCGQKKHTCWRSTLTCNELRCCCAIVRSEKTHTLALTLRITCNELPLLLRPRACNELKLLLRQRAVRKNTHAGESGVVAVV